MATSRAQGPAASRWAASPGRPRPCPCRSHRALLGQRGRCPLVACSRHTAAKRTRACPLAACSTRPLSPAPGLRAAQYGDAYARPWSNKLARGVAVNAPQYGGSQPCGMCIAYRGTGKGAGADPVPDAMQYALVTDLCPECAHGALAAHRTRLPLPLYHAVVIRKKRGGELVLALWQDPAQLQVLCALVASLAWRAHPARRPVAWQGLARTGCQGAGPGS